MRGKLIPIPTDNIGTVVTALRVRIAMLDGFFFSIRGGKEHEAARQAIREDIAALTWAMDNCQERPEVEIHDGH